MSGTWFGRSPSAMGDLEALLRARYPTLHAFIEEGQCRVRGTYALVEGGRAFDRYQLDMALPDDYPRSPPRIWETGGRIPCDGDRHVFRDGALCLGTPLALWIDLGGDFSLDRVLDVPVRNFLIGNSLVEQGEPWPHGERSHGAAGMVEHLHEIIGTRYPIMAATFLQAMVAGRVSKHSPCPCGNGKKILKCHSDGFRALRRLPAEVLDETARLILSEVDPDRLVA